MIHPALAFPEPLATESSPPRFRAALVAFAVLLYLAYMGISYTQWRAGEVLGDPATIFDVLLSRLAAGEGLEHPRTPGNHFFANHVMLWVFPAAIPYLFVDHLFTYIAMINLALASAVVPLGLLARRITGSEPVAAALVLLWSINVLTGSMLFSLHSENLSMPVWFALFWAVVVKRTMVVWLCAVALMLSKEDSAVWLALFAVWAWVVGLLERRQAAALFGFSLVTFAAFKVLMNSLPADSAKDVGFYWVAQRYGGIGDTPLEVAAHFAQHPVELLRRLVRPAWGLMVLAGGVICLLGWRAFLLTVPPAAMLFVSAEVAFYELRYYYAYLVLPALFLAACEGAHVLLKPGSRVSPRALAAGIAIVALVQLSIPTPADGRLLRPARSFPQATAGRLLVERTADRLGPDARIMAQWHLAAFVPRGRQRLNVLPSLLTEADALILDRAGFPGEIPPRDWQRILDAVFDPNGRWQATEVVDTLWVFEPKRARNSGGS